MNARFAWAMARRETRASRRRFALYGGCMALGIAALVGLHGVRETVRGAVAAQSRSLLGADLRLASRAPFGPPIEERVAELERSGEVRSARITRLGSMALAPASGRTRLVDVQAVEGGFPFYGGVRTEPAGRWEELRLAEPVALVESSLLVQLDTEVGDELVLGESRFRIAAAVLRAPGGFGLQTRVAPRVFIARRELAQTGLVQPGSLVDHRLYLRAPQAPLVEWLERHRSTLEAERVRIQTVDGYQEDLSRSFGALTRYLGLVGLAALALGGIAVASGVRVFVREKLDTVAVLRSLGARPRDVLATYGLLALALGGAAGITGAALGAALQWWLPELLSGFLPVQVEPSVSVSSVLVGIGLGLWVTLLFGAGPLLDLSRVPPLRALRADFAARSGPRRGRTALVAALLATLLLASLWQAPRATTGLAFAGGLTAVLALLATAAAGAATWLRRHRPRAAPFWLRQGIASLFRPRNHTVATTVAIGFGLFLVSTLHGVQANVLRQIAVDTRPDRPNLVLFDVQRDQLADVERFLEERGASIFERAALVSARIARLGGRETRDWLGGGELEREFRWALRREYRLTYSADLRESETVVAGRWWGSDEPAPGAAVPVSLEVDIAETLGVGPGDAIGWEIQGVRIDSFVQSLRRVDWGRMGTNFFVVFPPGVLDDAPQSSVVVARLEEAGARAELQRDLVARFPNVSALDATLLLRALDAMLTETGRAVRILALLTLATGLLILVAAAAATRHERTREALLLRTLGASSATVWRIVATEAAVLAGLAVVVGSGLAVVASWALVHWLFELPFDPPWAGLAALGGGTLVVTAVVGALHGRPARAQSPLAALREAEIIGAP